MCYRQVKYLRNSASLFFEMFYGYKYNCEEKKLGQNASDKIVGRECPITDQQ